MSRFIPLQPTTYPEEEMKDRAEEFFQLMDKRRTVRHFSDKPVPLELMKTIIRTASTAPSGAHKQPWTFCLVSSEELKSQIRSAAEVEEYENYHGRMSERWLKDLAPLGTDWNKEFLEIAPWLIVVFKKVYEMDGEEKANNYYVNESVGLASGFLLAAIHNAGLVSLTHTPSPMNFLTKLLGRPDNERPFLLIPVGFPAGEVRVPDLQRKDFQQIAEVYS